MPHGFKKKLDLASNLAVAIERLLPEECGSCKIKYTVMRNDKPTLQCAGCSQGIHEQCLSELLGEGAATLSTLHGSLTWLCQTCTPNLSMMTVITPGGPVRPTSRKLVERQGTSSQVAPVDEIADRLANLSVSAGTTGDREPVTPPLANLISAPSDNNSSAQASSPINNTGDTNAPQGVDCQLFSKGECPFGISGEKGGLCAAVHRKRCSRFMRWGSKAVKGCKDVSCPNLHPTVCPASLDLSCQDKSCPHKIHVYKCRRYKPNKPKSDRPQTPENRPGKGPRLHGKGPSRDVSEKGYSTNSNKAREVVHGYACTVQYTPWLTQLQVVTPDHVYPCQLVTHMVELQCIVAQDHMHRPRVAGRQVAVLVQKVTQGVTPM